MCRKIVWCYIIVLTLLDISLNTKLSAQGKSQGNGASVHESLMEGISLQQEWVSEEGAGGAGGAALALRPAALAFGRRALAEAHALRVTITNTANETVHLASVAGTTPDFHASFFESKTLAPQANTSFSVVYLGRREGPTAAHLYIHTSKGVHKYPVSAEGVASSWRVWPLVGLRVPHNATLRPLLTLYNPTDTTIQVREVYSSGAWLGLELPAGGGAAPRAAWALPPHAARAVVRLAVRLPTADRNPMAAYIRIKGNMTGGGLVIAVEATPAPAGEYLSPVQLRLRTRGSRDSPDSIWIEAGSSSTERAGLSAGAAGACRSPRDPPAPLAPPAPPSHTRDKHTHNGARAEAAGVRVGLVRDELLPRQELEPAVQVTLDYAKMWAGYVASAGNGSEGSGAEGAVCAGWVRVGRAAMAYSLRLLPGTLALHPNELHFITCDQAEAARARVVTALNEFPEPLLVTHVEFPPEVQELFHTESLAPLSLPAGARGVAARLRLRAAAPGAMQAEIAIHTNLTDYTLPLLIYEGVPTIEWEWPNSADGTLRLGAVGAGPGGWRAVRVRLRNAAAAPLCVTRLAASLPPPASATFQLVDAARQASCIPGGGSARALLTVRVGRAGGALAGVATAHTRHGAAHAPIRLSAHDGSLRAVPVQLPPAAPYVPAQASLELESSMSLRMRVLRVEQPPAARDPALSYIPGSPGDVPVGRGAAGALRYEAEAHCHPACYTGLQLDTADGSAWLSRGSGAAEELRRDAELQRARHLLLAAHNINFTLLLHTTEVLGVPVSGSGALAWPRVLAGGGARAGLAAVGAGAGAGVPLRLRARNPASRALLLQPRLAVLPLQLGGEDEQEEEACVGCVWSEASFQLGEWRATRGEVVPAPAPAPEPAPAPPYLLLQPGAEVEFTVTFTPTEPADLAAYLYLRNNLTIVERVLVRGRGALAQFSLGGRRPNASSAIVVEVAECGAGGAGGAARALALRNTGRVPLRLRDWRVAGRACGARGFRLQPCAPVRLQPGEAHQLRLHFAADWTLARAQAALTVRAGGVLARWPLAGLAPARLLPACAARAPRAPFEAELRAGGLALAVLALLGALALGAADAERALRRHRSARAGAPAHAPLDLRALGRAPPAAPAGPPPAARPAPAPRRRRAARRAAGAGDAAAERLAFSRWRAAAGAARDDSRSSEEGEGPPAPPAAPPPPPRGDAESSSPDSSPPPLRDSYSSLSRRAEDEEGASSGEDSSSPAEGRAPTPHAPPQGPPATHVPARGSRQRREGAEARRSERKSAERGETSGAGSARGGGRGGAGGRGARGTRRRSRAASPAPRAATPEPRPPPPAPPHPAVRWGASWSDVVSRGNIAGPDEGGGSSAPAPLAPIGSDVRRRLGSHSLFYYGSAPAWPPAAPAPSAPPAPEENGGYRSLESLWGSSAPPLAPGAAWLWGGAAGGGGPAPPAPPAAAVRPPPGFSAPRAVRPYDPFQSLASIWTPAALDWRMDPPSPPPPGALPATPPLPADLPEPPPPNNNNNN